GAVDQAGVAGRRPGGRRGGRDVAPRGRGDDGPAVGPAVPGRQGGSGARGRGATAAGRRGPGPGPVGGLAVGRTPRRARASSVAPAARPPAPPAAGRPAPATTT